MTKYVNVPLHQIALEALTAATLKKTHPELFIDNSNSKGLSGLGRLRAQKIIQSRVSRGLTPSPN